MILSIKSLLKWTLSTYLFLLRVDLESNLSYFNIKYVLFSNKSPLTTVVDEGKKEKWEGGRSERSSISKCLEKNDN